MKMYAFFLACSLFSSNTFCHRDLYYYDDVYCEVSIQGQIDEWVKNNLSSLNTEQKIQLYSLINDCMIFTKKLASFAKLTSLLVLQTTKIHGMTVGAIGKAKDGTKSESIFENVELLRSLCNAVELAEKQYDDALYQSEYTLDKADLVVQDTFKVICNDVYDLINQCDSFLDRLDTIKHKSFNTSMDNVQYVFDSTGDYIKDVIHRCIINQQSDLTVMLYNMTSLHCQNAQLYFDMLNMYANILNGYRAAVEYNLSF